MTDWTERDPQWLIGLVAMGTSLGCGPPSGFTLEAGDETGDGFGGSGSGDSGSGDSGDGDNGIPLELVAGATDKTGAFIVLRFSEPLAPPDGVDPTDFRISFAISTAYYYQGQVEYQYSVYYDPNFFTFYYPYYPDQPLFEAVSIGLGQMPTDLVLRFETPLDSYVCESLAVWEADLEMNNQIPEYEGRVGLFPHYAPGATPVRSADGESLAAIGPEWVAFEGLIDYNLMFGFPKLDPQIKIACKVEP